MRKSLLVGKLRTTRRSRWGTLKTLFILLNGNAKTPATGSCFKGGLGRDK
jgi:hypothetical protein